MGCSILRSKNWLSFASSISEALENLEESRLHISLQSIQSEENKV
jgi:hypothetical protein